MRARLPDRAETLVRDGVPVYYEVYGAGEPAVLLLPTWQIVDSRTWKAQIPYLARHGRVVTFDGRGSGRSGRPGAVAAYDERELARDALAVLDATGTRRAVLVAHSSAAFWAVRLATEHPDRVAGVAFIAPAGPFDRPSPEDMRRFEARLERHDGWDKFNRHYWRDHFADFLEFFVREMLNEPYSEKPVEDCVGYGLGTTPETLALTWLAQAGHDHTAFARRCRALSCPALILHGDADAIRPPSVGERLAALTDGAFVLLRGSGHAPHVRDPVRVNLLIREFAERAR